MTNSSFYYDKGQFERNAGSAEERKAASLEAARKDQNFMNSLHSNPESPEQKNFLRGLASGGTIS